MSDVDAVAAAVVRKLRAAGLVVRLTDEQLDEIAGRLMARIDDRIAAQEPGDDRRPDRRNKRRLRL